MTLLRFASMSRSQGSLFIKIAKLSKKFFEQLKKHLVPVEEAAIKHIANNSMAIDVYCWLAFQRHALTTPTSMTWKALYA